MVVIPLLRRRPLMAKPEMPATETEVLKLTEKKAEELYDKVMGEKSRGSL